jgi:ABC-type antimicrobial peptide transport system permease subunit
MNEKRTGRIKALWRKYRTWIAVLVTVYVVIIVALVVLAGGPQRAPFLYQIF